MRWDVFPAVGPTHYIFVYFLFYDLLYMDPNNITDELLKCGLIVCTHPL